MIEVRWHGRGGQGCWTVARLLGLAATQFEGRYALAVVFLHLGEFHALFR